MNLSFRELEVEFLFTRVYICEFMFSFRTEGLMDTFINICFMCGIFLTYKSFCICICAEELYDFNGYCSG